MLKLIGLVSLQSLFLVTSQLLLKIALTQFGRFEWSAAYFKTVFTNLPFAGSGLSILIAMSLWVHVLKHYEFSLAYPLVSLSFVFGLLAAQFILHEPVSLTRWIGLAVILVGIFLITKQA